MQVLFTYLLYIVPVWHTLALAEFKKRTIVPSLAELTVTLVLGKKGRAGVRMFRTALAGIPLGDLTSRGT